MYPGGDCIYPCGEGAGRASLPYEVTVPSQDDRDSGDSSGECHPIFLR